VKAPLSSPLDLRETPSGTMVSVWSWIIVGGMYVLGMGLFSVLGGLGSAAEGFRRWGETATALRNRTTSASR
jgi:hypothetical protein